LPALVKSAVVLGIAIAVVVISVVHLNAAATSATKASTPLQSLFLSDFKIGEEFFLGILIVRVAKRLSSSP
jgi:hypothetical protein